MHIRFLSIFLLVFPIFCPGQENYTWPVEFESSHHVITLYEPQLDNYQENNKLEGRMAVMVETPESQFFFGALWFIARLETDKSSRTASLEDVEIPGISFPDVEDPKKLEDLKNIIAEEILSWNIPISLDNLISDMEGLIEPKEEKVNNTPPKIFIRKKPAILVSIDGKPIIKTLTGGTMEYVVNTPFFMVRVKGGKYFYLKGGDFWFSAKKPTGPWVEDGIVPADIRELARQSESSNPQDSAIASLDKAPEIIVSTVPAELVFLDGKPEYAPIQNTELLYVKNTESDIILDIESQEHFILIAGRWYRAKKLAEGEWTFIEPSALPGDFKNIPEESEMANVRASVPNTPESKTALLEQSVPETAAIEREGTTVQVSYDGPPKFEAIEGTTLEFALNTDKTVLFDGTKYFCVDDGIWFIASSAKGPWEVSEYRPKSVEDIPVESPVNNVKYVYVYESTPEVVYVGYTPGYTYAYVYSGVVVYGSGYYYQPWYSTVYYPRPVTYGFGVHYNPYTGWGFSVGFSYGWVGWGFHPHYHSYWGPHGYHYGYRHGYYAGYRHGYRHGYHNGYRNPASLNQYRRSAYQNRAASTRPVNSRQPQVKPSTRPNNVYTDRRGNVYQRDNNGNFNSQNKSPATRPTTRPGQTKPQTRPQNKPGQNNSRPSTKPQSRPQTKPSTQQRNRDLNQSHQKRQQGQRNNNRYQQQRSAPSPRPQSRPSRSTPRRAAPRRR